MIGVDMGFQRRDELEAQFVDQRRVAPHLLETGSIRIASRVRRTEQIGIGRGLRIEQLAEDERGPHVSTTRAACPAPRETCVWTRDGVRCAP